MAEVGDSSPQTTENPQQGNVSLDAAISFVGDFTAAAQVFETGVALVMMVAGSIKADTMSNKAHIDRLESTVTSLSERIAGLANAATQKKNRDEINRPLGGGENTIMTTSDQLSDGGG